MNSNGWTILLLFLILVSVIAIAVTPHIPNEWVYYHIEGYPLSKDSTISELSRDGWEVVSIQYLSSDKYVALVKRPAGRHQSQGESGAMHEYIKRMLERQNVR